MSESISGKTPTGKAKSYGAKNTNCRNAKDDRQDALGRLPRGPVHSYLRGTPSARFRKRHLLRPTIACCRGVAVNRVDAARNHRERDCGFARNSSLRSDTNTRNRNVQIGSLTGAKRVCPQASLERVNE